MERVDVKNILNKIKAFRQSFDINNSTLEEWEKILKPYSYKDVEKKLDDYFREGSNFGQYPDAYYLIKYLKTEDEKSRIGEIVVKCQICREKIPYIEYNEHFDRCSSIEFIKNNEEYLKREFNKEKMWSMNNTEFEKLYWKFCEELLKVIPEGVSKHSLENAILTHNGFSPKYSMNEISGFDET